MDKATTDKHSKGIQGSIKDLIYDAKKNLCDWLAPS